MFNAIKPLGELLKLKQINTSDPFFVLNTKLTTAMLVLFSVLLSTKELFGKSIDCYTGSDAMREVMNEYCWTNGTFIYANFKSFDGVHGSEIISYGVSAISQYDKIIYQRYYQWIVMILIAQALVCYLPAYMWKSFEGGLLKDLCHGLESIIGRDGWAEQKKKVIDYFSGKCAGAVNTNYAYRYAICKALSLLTIVFNIVVLDMAIPDFWQNYAKAVSALVFGRAADWYKHNSLVFPKQAKCLFFSYGPSGSIEHRDSLCLLPLNNINEKIFAVIWIWYIVLLCITVVNGIFVAVTFTNKNLRLAFLKSRTMMHVSNKQICSATNNGHLGDCFLLKQMAKNLNPIIFIEIMEDLSIERNSKFNDY